MTFDQKFIDLEHSFTLAKNSIEDEVAPKQAIINPFTN